MKQYKTDIEGVLLLEPQRYGDARGYFVESFNAERFRQVTGLEICFVQDNESRSVRGVIRGLHYQKAPYAQAKLVRVVAGKVLDVVVDLRKSSPTFGKHLTVELSAENGLQLFIPKGLAHGYAVLSEEAVFQYKCDAYYAPEAECGIAWNDPDLGIKWPINTEDAILSEKDCKHPIFKNASLFE